jgi:putrescine importer
MKAFAYSSVKVELVAMLFKKILKEMISLKEEVRLSRTLSLFQVVMLGLAWMTPMVVFVTYGEAAEITKGMQSSAYLIAFFVILFTAHSYRVMAKEFPISGSAYSFTKNSINPQFGFLVGWVLLLDYALTPLIASLIFGIYLNAQFPGIPTYVWILMMIAAVTVVNIFGVKLSANTSILLVVFQVLFLILFCAFCIRDIMGGMGEGTLASVLPFASHKGAFVDVVTGASILCFSFLGFDSVTTLSEETRNPQKNIPKAIWILMAITGILYLSVSYLSQLVHPGFAFKNLDSASLELARHIGGDLLASIFIAATIVGQFTAGISSTASISRILYVMGRDGVLPKQVFGYIHPKFRTPVVNIVLVAIISLLGIALNLSTVISFINFGALTAFLFVNISVISQFYIRNNRRSFGDSFRYLIIPLIGSGFILWLWSYANKNSLILGFSWTVLGVIYLAYLTKFFKKRLANYNAESVVS